MATCRVCLQNNPDCISIFTAGENGNGTVSNMLVEYAFVEVFENDGLPSTICNTCLTKLEQALGLRKQIIESDTKLRKDLQSINIKQEQYWISHDMVDFSDCSTDNELQNPASKMKRKPQEVMMENVKSEKEEQIIESDIKVQEILSVKEEQDCTSHPHVDDLSNSNTGDLLKLSSTMKKNSPRKEISLILNPSSQTNRKVAQNRMTVKKQIIESDTSNHKDLIKLYGRRKDGMTIESARAEKCPVSCMACRKTFKNQYYFELHNMKHIGYAPYKCEVCKKGFSMRWLLNLHLPLHTGAKPYSCDICGKSFRFPSSVYSHKRTHTGERPYKCDVCSKRFVQIGALHVHQRTHTGEKPFCCEICSKLCRDLGALTKHKKMHRSEVNPPERSHPCPTCGKLFFNTAGVRNHLITHMEEKLYSCDICKKSFKTNSTLKIHIRIHDEGRPKPHSCRVCDKSFTQSIILVRHMRIHSGETPYPCKLCPKRFKYSHHLLKHVKTHHQDSVPSA